jgi:hypothetical protein
LVVSNKSHVLNVSILLYHYSLNLLKFQIPGVTIVNIAEFTQKLTSTNDDYERLSPPGGGMVHFRFIGNFEGEITIWDAHLYTLAYYVNKVAKYSQRDVSIRQFIDVDDMGEMGRKIEIGLNLPNIDETAILKTMIMIRQYKRLHRGRHEYGEKISVKK